MKILFATDGLPAAFEALSLLEKVASREHSEITVISVTHSGIPSPEHLPLVLDSLEDRRAQALEIVDAAVERLLEGDFQAAGRTAEGDPAEEIVMAVEQDWYDTTVVGAGSRSWLGRLLLGSVSTRLLHSSPSAVLVVHPSPPIDTTPRVLIGADGSRGAELATRTVLDFVDPRRCEATVVSVVPRGSGVADLPYAEDDGLLAQGRRRAEQLASLARHHGMKVEAEVVRGHPVEGLLEEGATRGVDFIAVGTKGLGRARHLLGSVSDQVARLAPATLVARRFST